MTPDAGSPARDRLSHARTDAVWAIDDLRDALAVLTLTGRSADVALQDVENATSASVVRAAWRASNTLLADAIRVVNTHATTLTGAISIMLTDS